MIWLASFPRSGSTFFRIVLDEVYGIESSTFHREPAYPVDENYWSYPVVKTHLLPAELIPSDPSIPAVYLVRDGRDCMVSLAHYRKQLLAPDSDFEQNLLEAIDAQHRSHFGGWSEHVRRWLDRASLVIRFEDLVEDAIGCVERLRPWLDLAEPRRERLPSFADLKSNDYKYGSGRQHGFDPDARARWRRGKFRRGQRGAWKDELPEPLYLRFLRRHGRELIRLGYLREPPLQGPGLAAEDSGLATEDSGLAAKESRLAAQESGAELRDLGVRGKGLPNGASGGQGLVSTAQPLRPSPPSPDGVTPEQPAPKGSTGSGSAGAAGPERLYVHLGGRRRRRRRVLIDATKLLDAKVDGIRRYVHELLRAMIPLAQERRDAWRIDVRFGPSPPFPLLQIGDHVQRGQPPPSQIPILLRPDSSNPLVRTKRQLKSLKGRLGWELVRETVHYNYLKTARSFLRRWQELRLLAAQACRIWGGRWSRDGGPRYDLVHLTLPNTWAFYRGLEAPLLTTVHDLCHKVCPQFQMASNNRSLASGLRFAERVGSDYVAVSHATKRQMVELLGVDPLRIQVVHEGCDDRRFQPVGSAEQMARVRSKYAIPDEPYVLSVSTLEPRKNLIRAVRAFVRLVEEAPEVRANFVIAGSFGWGDLKELDEAAQACRRIRVIGHVEDEDLPALYSAAAVLCFVSHYEGFGLPLVEAMSCGAPSVYGDVASMPEVAGGAGLPASPCDAEQIKGAIKRLLTDADLRRRLSRAAVLRSLDFTWRQAAEQTLAGYQRFIEARRNARGDRRVDQPRADRTAEGANREAA